MSYRAAGVSRPARARSGLNSVALGCTMLPPPTWQPARGQQQQQQQKARKHVMQAMVGCECAHGGACGCDSGVVVTQQQLRAPSCSCNPCWHSTAYTCAAHHLLVISCGLTCTFGGEGSLCCCQVWCCYCCPTCCQASQYTGCTVLEEWNRGPPGLVCGGCMYRGWLAAAACRYLSSTSGVSAADRGDDPGSH
jgi:hypothetical protein